MRLCVCVCAGVRVCIYVYLVFVLFAHKTNPSKPMLKTAGSGENMTKNRQIL